MDIMCALVYSSGKLAGDPIYEQKGKKSEVLNSAALGNNSDDAKNTVSTLETHFQYNIPK